MNKNGFCTAVIRIGIVLIKTHFIALRRLYVWLRGLRPSPRGIPRVSKVGLWNQHRSGGLLAILYGQWPTRPSSLNPPLSSEHPNGHKSYDRCCDCAYGNLRRSRMSRCPLTGMHTVRVVANIYMVPFGSA